MHPIACLQLFSVLRSTELCTSETRRQTWDDFSGTALRDTTKTQVISPHQPQMRLMFPLSFLSIPTQRPSVHWLDRILIAFYLGSENIIFPKYDRPQGRTNLDSFSIGWAEERYVKFFSELPRWTNLTMFQKVSFPAFPRFLCERGMNLGGLSFTSKASAAVARSSPSCPCVYLVSFPTCTFL